MSISTRVLAHLRLLQILTEVDGECWGPKLREQGTYETRRGF